MKHMHALMIAGLLSLASAHAANACPAILQSLSTQYLPSESGDLCTLSDRYEKALEKMKAAGLNPPERAAELLGPRFINMPDWLSLGPARHFNPWLIYAPVPKTWQKWELGEALIAARVQSNQSSAGIAPLTLEWVEQVHAAAFSGFVRADAYRSYPEYGLNVKKKHAVTAQQIAALQDNYPSLIHPNTVLTHWHSVQCIEDRSPADQAAFADLSKFDPANFPDSDSTVFFKANDDQLKQCGYTVYADPQEIALQLQKWLVEQNSWAQALTTSEAHDDPIEAASRAQRWFVSIHPFREGNGRTSRLLMDAFFKSLGLPAPLLKNMDDDTMSSARPWAAEVGEGLERAVETTEMCANDPHNVRCHIVSLTPKGK